MLDGLLNDIARLISDNTWLAPVLAIAAGIITSFTPCSLSSVPLIIGYVGGMGERSTKRSFIYSVIFALGASLTFFTMGIIAASAGMLMGMGSPVWYIILGVIMMLMSLQTMEIYSFIPSSNLVSRNRRRGSIGAFIAGVLSSIFSSPCSTPVLVVLVTVVAREGRLLYGILLMLLYSVGYSALTLIAGTSVGFVRRLKSSQKYRVLSEILKYVMGIAIMAIGFYMFYLAF